MALIFVNGSNASAGSTGVIQGIANGDAIAIATVDANGNAIALANSDLVAFADGISVTTGSGITVQGVTYSGFTVPVAARTTIQANAESVNGDADSNATLTTIGGLLDSNINAGAASTISALLSSNVIATAETVGNGSSGTRDATATALTGSALGINNGGGITVGSDSTIAVRQIGTVSAEADAATGPAFANADFNLAAGIDGGRIGIGANSSLLSTSTATVVSDAYTVNGNATAETGRGSPLDNFGIADATIVVGGASTSLEARGITVTNAFAETTSGDASANAAAGNTFGVENGNFTIGSTGSLIGTASLNLTADALTVGDGPASRPGVGATNGDFSNATGTFDNVIGIGALSSANTDIGVGASSTLTAVGVASIGATADATNADATAVVTSGTVAGSQLTNLVVGADSIANLTANAGINADAATTVGDANASATGANVFGVQSGTIDISAGSTLSTGATFVQRATAETVGNGAASLVGGTNGDSAVATSTFQEVVSIADVNNIRVGADGVLTALTNSTISATAGGINTGNADATANADSGLVAGVDSSTIIVGGDLRGANGTANFQGAATSTAAATTTTGAAIANADASQVFGITNGSITVNGGITTANDGTGTLTSLGVGTLSAAAQTVTGNADAGGTQIVTGFNDTRIDISGSGNVTGLADGFGVVTAAATNGSAGAVLNTFRSSAIDTNGENITIGGSGTVSGFANLRNTLAGGGTSGVIAETVGGNGSQTAAATLGTAAATGLDANGANITINGTGSINGRAVLGLAGTGSNSMLVTDSYDVIASVEGNGSTATATASDIDAIGIISNGSGTLTAGPGGGSIAGEAVAGLNVMAATQNNPDARSSATITDGRVVGIADANLLGGMSGANTISGRSNGVFNATATSVGGNSDATSTASAFGITDTDGTRGTMTLSGNVQAVAQLTNTVMATTVQGNAVATATSNAVGLNNYNVTIIGGGGITGRADALSRAIASDVTQGSAQANARL